MKTEHWSDGYIKGELISVKDAEDFKQHFEDRYGENNISRALETAIEASKDGKVMICFATL